MSYCNSFIQNIFTCKIIASLKIDRVDALSAKEATLRTEALNIIMKSGNDIKVIGSNIDAVIAPFGGSQTGERLIFGVPYAKGGLIDNVNEYFAGPHDFLSSWNYENIDGKTYLKDNGTLINISSGALLIPAMPLAAATFIENNIKEINTINYIQKEENKKIEDALNEKK